MKPSRTSSEPHPYPGPAWRSGALSGRSSPPSIWGKILRLIACRRRLFAALLFCAAASIAVQQLTPASPATTTVMVAAHDLAAGHILGAADLVAAPVSPHMVPDGALRPESATALTDNNAPTTALQPPAGTEGVSGTGGSALASSTDWLGNQLSGPLRRGEVLTDASLLGSGLLIGAPAGSQAVPLRLSDPSTLALLRQGQLVSVVLSSSQGMDGPVHNDVLAESVPVLWTPALAQENGGLLPAQENAAIVVVGASADQAVQLAGAINRGKVFLILLNNP